MRAGYQGAGLPTIIRRYTVPAMASVEAVACRLLRRSRWPPAHTLLPLDCRPNGSQLLPGLEVFLRRRANWRCARAGGHRDSVPKLFTGSVFTLDKENTMGHRVGNLTRRGALRTALVVIVLSCMASQAWANCTSSCGGGYCVISAPCGHGRSSDVGRNGPSIHSPGAVAVEGAGWRFNLFASLYRALEPEYSSMNADRTGPCVGTFTNRDLTSSETGRQVRSLPL